MYDIIIAFLLGAFTVLFLLYFSPFIYLVIYQSILKRAIYYRLVDWNYARRITKKRRQMARRF